MIILEADIIIREAPYIQFKIIDNGAGIKPEFLNKIFMPFFTTKSVGKGTGMGLCISKQIINNIKGDIKIYSEEGHGTQVVLTLPLYQKYNINIENKKEGTKLNNNTFIPLKRKALIADDEHDICFIIEKILKELNFEVSIVHNGADALHKIEEAQSLKEEYNLLITDLYMPELDGIELIAKIKKEKLFQGKILVISGSHQQSHFFSPEYSWDGRINKPFSKEDIEKELSKFSEFQESKP